MAGTLRRGAMLVFAVLIACVIATGLGSVVPRPFQFSAREVVGQESPSSQTRRILILSNPIHTDIALPADPDVLEAFGFVSLGGLELAHPGVAWIVFGWGGRSFYIETPTWSDLKPGPVLDALTWDASVMHVRRAGNIPQTLDEVLGLDLDSNDFNALVKAIRQSFRTEPGRNPEPVPGAAYDAHDIFFPAEGGFNALIGCNTWTARMLRAAGYRTGAWTPLPANLTWSLSMHNHL